MRIRARPRRAPHAPGKKKVKHSHKKTLYSLQLESNIDDGSYQADRPQVHRRQGPPQTGKNECIARRPGEGGGRFGRARYRVAGRAVAEFGSAGTTDKRKRSVAPRFPLLADHVFFCLGSVPPPGVCDRALASLGILLGLGLNG